MRLFPAVLLSVVPITVLADIPHVITDIAPVHSLVAQVMGDLGTADVLVSGGASPHDFQFTFAQASALQDADLVIWAGPTLTPWLEEALQTLARQAERLTLLDSDGWRKLEPRDWGEDHGQDEHDDHDDHGATLDPHAWLDPQVAIVWTQHISDTLSDLDPEHAATYRTNADASVARLVTLDDQIAIQMAALPDATFLVPHDAYQYFGARYGLPAAGTITLSDGQSPSPAKVAQLQGMVRDLGVTCVLSDPQARTEWSDLVREGTAARTAIADPMGGGIAPGPDHYFQMMTALADAYADCLQDQD